jgi:hypothetical protein
MTNQGWKDWEDYNHGLQGINTGSGYNQMGLQDRKKSPFKTEVKERKHKLKKNRKPKNIKSKTFPKKENNQWKILFFFAGLIASAFFMSEAGVKDSAAYLIGGLLSGFICATFYKVLLAIAMAAIAFGIFSNL